MCGFGRQHDFCTEKLLDNYLSRGNLGSNALGLCRTLDAALSMSVSEIVYLQYFTIFSQSVLLRLPTNA